MNYPINIPSIAHIHPPLANNPNVLNVPVMQGVFSSKAAGDPLDMYAVRESEETVQTLAGSRRRLPQVINDDVVETAKNRVHLLRETHAAVQFGLQPGLAGIQQFLQGQFDQLRQQFNARFDEQQAMMYNIRIVSRNQRDIHSPHRPLQKYIPGDGNALAAPLAVNAALAQTIQEFQPHGIVGTVHPQFNPDVDAYQHIDILRLVVFYNDDFGILPGDQLPERKRKIRNWLMEHLV